MTDIQIESVIKDKYYAILAQAEQAAEKDFNAEFLPSLNGLSDDEKASIIQIEQEKLEKIIDSSEFPSYSYEYRECEMPLNLFSNRFTILRVDDSKVLYTGAYYGKKSDLLAKMFESLTKNKPEYSFEDFKNDLIEPYFLNLNYTDHLKYKVIDNIREWQLIHFIEIVTIESTALILKIQDECHRSTHANDILKLNKDIFDNIMSKKEFSSSEELISMLKELTFLNDYNFETLNKNALLHDFTKFKKQDFNWYNITQGQYNEFESKIKEKRPTAAFTRSPLIFYSINKVIHWIEKVLSGKEISIPYKYIDLQKIYKETLQKAVQKSQDSISEYLHELIIYKPGAIEKSSTFLKLLKGLKYSCYVDKYIPEYLVDKEDEKHAEYHFILNSFLSDNIDYHIAELERAIKYCSEATYHAYKYNSLAEKENLPDNSSSSISFFILGLYMYDMVIETDLYRLYWDAFEKTSNIEYHSSLPSLLVTEISDLYASDLFYKFTNRLESHFDKCPIPNKELYIHSQLKRNRRTEFRSKESSRDFDDSKDIYSDLFKEFLQIELDYIRGTRDIKISTEIKTNTLPALLPIDNLKLTFGFSRQDESKLISAIKKLCLVMDILKDPISTADDFIQILLSKDLTTANKPIYLNCKTVEFSYIIKSLSPFFNSLNPITIEKSKLFYSKKGILINAQNLYSNTKTDIYKKKDIDKILNQLQ